VPVSARIASSAPFSPSNRHEGYVIADASSVYHELYRTEPCITEVGCWAHSRRRWSLEATSVFMSDAQEHVFTGEITFAGEPLHWQAERARAYRGARSMGRTARSVAAVRSRHLCSNCRSAPSQQRSVFSPPNVSFASVALRDNRQLTRAND
jgi:hypothetical protein